MGHALVEARAAIAALASVPAHELADGESVVRLHELQAQLESITAGATAAFDASGDWANDRAKTAAAWVSARCRVRKESADRTVRLGRAVRHMPQAESAWRAGRIHGDHVRLLNQARTTAPAAFAEHEGSLVEAAAVMRWHRFHRHVGYWRKRHDEDEAERDFAKLHDERRVHCSKSFQDQWILDGVLDPIGEHVFTSELDRIEGELFQADWNEAKARLGREPALVELARTPAQRRADALIEMARRAGTVPMGGRRPDPLFTVLVDYPTFERVCQLADGTVVTPGSLVPWLEDGWVQRVVFDSQSRVIDVGAQRRIFDGATRDAVEIRDQFECTDDLCAETGTHLQVDHIQPWAAGGPTIQDNGRLLCGYHNRWRHKRRPRGP